MEDSGMNSDPQSQCSGCSLSFTEEKNTDKITPAQTHLMSLLELSADLGRATTSFGERGHLHLLLSTRILGD